jgi:hypothetical protein
MRAHFRRRWIKQAMKVLTATFAAVPKDGVITRETIANGTGGSSAPATQQENRLM